MIIGGHFWNWLVLFLLVEGKPHIRIAWSNKVVNNNSICFLPKRKRNDICPKNKNDSICFLLTKLCFDGNDKIS